VYFDTLRIAAVFNIFYMPVLILHYGQPVSLHYIVRGRKGSEAN
jgi:hypothetical protein